MPHRASTQFLPLFGGGHVFARNGIGSVESIESIELIESIEPGEAIES